MTTPISLNYSKPLIMGILNVTPDSFSDGGDYPAAHDAISRALQMVREGADIIDVGGESTRPGAKRIDALEQKRRVLDVIGGLRRQLPETIPISIDTTLSEVAEAAIHAGAQMINDVSAGRDDANILTVAAKMHTPICLMHMQGTPATMQDNPLYDNVTTEVLQFLQERAEAAQQAGVQKGNIILDPGIGFGKRTVHNLQLIADLEKFVATGYPILLGASRKRFMGEIGNAESAEERMPATCATSALGVMSGVAIFRVHDVWQNRQAVDVAAAIKQQMK